MLQINELGLNLITEHEGLRLEAYHCAAGVLTIGYGHTGDDVHEGMVITEEEANALLADDVASFEEGVERMVGVTKTSGNEFSAMVSLAYNIGLTNFRNSSVLRFHKLGQKRSAADSFRLWNKSNGRVLTGLTRRREDERTLYLTPDGK